MFKAAPLPGSFMVIAFLGFVISIVVVFPKMPTWGFAFTLVFILMIVASLISMTYADAEASIQMDKKVRRKR